MTPACVLHLQNERVGYGIGRGEGVNVGAPGGGSSCSVGWPPNSGSPTARPPGRPVRPRTDVSTMLPHSDLPSLSVGPRVGPQATSPEYS
jgi:hypothetical protein